MFKSTEFSLKEDDDARSETRDDEEDEDDKIPKSDVLVEDGAPSEVKIGDCTTFFISLSKLN